MIKRFSSLILVPIVCTLLLLNSCSAQQNAQNNITSQDSLRGSLNPYRTWWDVNHYDIFVTPDYITRTIMGTNTITFTAVDDGEKMQIDLQQPMLLDKVVYQGRELEVSRNENVFYIKFPKSIRKGTKVSLELSFSGRPREAVNPPWDGGWIWKKDEEGNPFMSVACQGLGASVWYPNKDHQSDEPDSARLTIEVPDTLVAVGNGRLRSTEQKGNKKIFTWAVTNPINNYNIIPYIGKYASFSEQFQGEKGELDCTYYVLEYNIEKARQQFTQVKPMLQCFEHWFGPYPFYEDGFKLVESPHLGMEHQSAVAYGNKYGNGYLGRDLSGSGWGQKFDFIIIHESGHEWFGNNITSNDIADMWVHESFTNYSEALYVECQFGKKAASEYVIGTRKGIRNSSPIIGEYGVNKEGSGDMYSKGGNMIHTIRQLINDDEKFRMILRGLNREFYHSTINGKDVEDYFIKASGLDLMPVFNQYLRRANLPVLEYRVENSVIHYRWTDCVEGFNMKLKLAGENAGWIEPATSWKKISMKESAFKIDPEFYILTRKEGSGTKQ